MNADLHIANILTDHVVTFIPPFVKNVLFLQDYARPHVTKQVLFDLWGGLGVNPIKHLRDTLKQQYNRNQLAHTNLKELEKLFVLFKSEHVLFETIQNLIHSMPMRREEISPIRGYIRY